LAEPGAILLFCLVASFVFPSAARRTFAKSLVDTDHIHEGGVLLVRTLNGELEFQLVMADSVAAAMIAGKPEPTIAQIALLLVWLLCLGSWFVMELALYKRRYGRICECCDSSGYD
jgi:hypothetical protein